MSYENFKSDGHESDEVAGLLATLKRIEAPGDFDMRLKARIANSSATEKRPFPFLRLAIPIGVLGALAAAFFFAGIYTQPLDQVQVVPETPQQTGKSNVAPIISAAANVQDPKTESVQKPNETELADAKPNNSLQPTRPGTNTTERAPGGGSKDSTANIPEKPKFPRGFDPDAKVTNVPPGGLTPSAKIAVADVLRFIGVDAEMRSGIWIANSVKANSPAVRAGLKANDEIEALGDIPIARTTTFSGAVNFKTIRVKRDGKILKLGF